MTDSCSHRIQIKNVLEEYPRLTRADVQACLDYASRVMGNRFSVVQTA